MASTKKRGSVQTNVHKKAESKRIKHRSRLKKLGKPSMPTVPGSAGNKGV